MSGKPGRAKSGGGGGGAGPSGRQPPVDPDTRLVGGRTTWVVECEELGDGAFGKVFSAHSEEQPGEKGAVKLPTGTTVGDLRWWEEDAGREVNFLRGFSQMAADNHIIRLLDVGFLGSGRARRMGIVLERMGKSLKDIEAQARNNPRLILRVVDHIGSALVFLLEQKIAHRDVKPDNIMACLVEEGKEEEVHKLVFKLMDFGLARIVPEDGLQGQVGGLLYSSPEMRNGGVYGVASDWFGLGAAAADAVGIQPENRGEEEEDEEEEEEDGEDQEQDDQEGEDEEGEDEEDGDDEEGEEEEQEDDGDGAPYFTPAAVEDHDWVFPPRMKKQAKEELKKALDEIRPVLVGLLQEDPTKRTIGDAAMPLVRSLISEDELRERVRDLEKKMEGAGRQGTSRKRK